MKTRLWLLGLGIAAGLMVAIAAIGLLTRPYAYHGSLIDPPVAARDIALTDQNAQAYRLSDHSGQVVLVFFGYTSCPDACPATLAQFKQVKARLGRQADQVQFVLITVDPERDTAERLREYLGHFDPAFIGLTGPEAAMEPIWQSYGVFRAERALDAHAPETGGHAHTEGEYLVDHTVRIYAIDPQGNLRLTYTPEVLPDDLAEDIQQLLRGG